MGRLLQAAVLVLGMVGVATAGPTRKVKVDSTPAGATVYIDSVENGAACEATPCTINVPLGSRVLIIQLAKHDPELWPLDVVRGKRPLPVSVKLKGAVGTIRIVGAPRGATVRVNDEDKGKVGRGTLEIEVPAEPASVTITHDGKTQTELVDVSSAEPVEIEYEGSDSGEDVVADAGDGEDAEDDEDDEDGGEIRDSGDVETPSQPAARAPYLEAGVAFDIGFRTFQYVGAEPFTNSGEVVIGPAVELWPGRMLGVKPLGGLSLFARVQFSPTHQQVTRQVNGMQTDVGAETLWGALEVSLRQKFTLGSLGVAGSVGFVRDQVEFSADNQTAFQMVPSADYQSIRVGARVSYLAKFEPYAGGELRLVQSGGEIANRADSAETSGYQFALGVRTAFGPLGVRAEFSRAAYTWKFTGASTPSGASDSIMWVGLLVGYDY